MVEQHAPTLYVIAGPNGAGKTTLARTRLCLIYPHVSFVNPDEVAREQLGRPAETESEFLVGARRTAEWRRTLIRDRHSLMNETTFASNASTQLVTEALEAGYRVIVHHVGLANAELARERVASRVADGGHPVPAAKIRERFQRGLDRIREAARMAHRCHVWDNSRIEVPLVPVLTLENGEIVSQGRSLPAWVETAYSA